MKLHILQNLCLLFSIRLINILKILMEVHINSSKEKKDKRVKKFIKLNILLR